MRKRRAHRHDSFQAAQITVQEFLRVRKHLQVCGRSHDECDSVRGNPAEYRFRLEIPHDYERAACVEGRAGAAAVAASPVEPGRHVQRYVARAERVLHDDVMCGEYFVDVVDRH